MGRELASAVARWIHLEDLGVRPRLVHVCDIDPKTLAWYERLADTPAPQQRPRGAARRPRGRGGLHRRAAQPACRALRGGARGRQAPLGREAVRDRPRGQRDDHGRGGRPPRAGGALLVGDALLPGRPGGVALDRGRALRPSDRGPLAVPALERPRPGEADQLEAPRGDQRRLRLPGRPRHACTAPAAARRLGSARRAGAARRHRQGAARRARRARAASTRPTTRSCSAAPSTAARSWRCASRPSGSRPARRTPG